MVKARRQPPRTKRGVNFTTPQEDCEVQRKRFCSLAWVQASKEEEVPCGLSMPDSDSVMWMTMQGGKIAMFARQSGEHEDKRKK